MSTTKNKNQVDTTREYQEKPQNPLKTRQNTTLNEWLMAKWPLNPQCRRLIAAHCTNCVVERLAAHPDSGHSPAAALFPNFQCIVFVQQINDLRIGQNKDQPSCY